MKRFFVIAACTLVLSQARATEIEVNAAVGTFPFSVGVALRELVIGNDPDVKLELGVSNRALLAGIGLGQDYGPAGVLTGNLRFAFVFDPTGAVNANAGVRLRAIVRGTVGPGAVEATGLYWSTPSDAANPLAVFERDAEPIEREGYLLGLSGSYRLSRILVVKANTRFASIGSRIEARLEGRESDYSLSGGALVAWQAPGITYAGVFGAKYSPQDQPFTVGAEALLGAGPSGFDYGLIVFFDTTIPDDLGTLSAFVAYEPWRSDVYPLRFGAGFETPAGPGVLYTRVQGGSLLGGLFPWGVQIGYRLFLDELLKPQP